MLFELKNTTRDHASDTRSLERRSVYLGEGLTFEVRSDGCQLEAEAIDLTPEGLGVALVDPSGIPGVGEVVTVRYTGRGATGATQDAVVRHVSCLRSGERWLPRIGLSLVAGDERAAGVRFACPETLPAFAAAASPWFHRERLHFRIIEVGAGGMTVRATQPNAPLLAGMELDFDAHLAYIGVERARGRVTSVRRGEIDVAWVDPSRALLKALAEYLLVGEGDLTPATLRAGGLAVGSVERAVSYDYAASCDDFDEILELRLRAHQAEGHLESASIDDMRSPFDAHARHLTCRFDGRIVGYVRVIFVDGTPARSQYVTLGGHEVPQWLWDAGFVEAGAGAIDPDFQRAGLFVPLMAHSVRVAVQSGHRYVLGACDDGLLGMYREMGFEVLEERTCEPKPGWRFRSHLIYLDAERLMRDPNATRAVAAMASAIGFAGLREDEHVVDPATQRPHRRRVAA